MGAGAVSGGGSGGAGGSGEAGAGGASAAGAAAADKPAEDPSGGGCAFVGERSAGGWLLPGLLTALTLAGSRGSRRSGRSKRRVA
jgi:hypothetical protein